MIEDAADALRLAREGDEAAFGRLTAPFRRELHVHCYRILGSTQDAEDVLQETLLAAWRGLDGFEERASVRTWLYRIATNRCLNEIRKRDRRPLTASASGRSMRGDPNWLEPYPDSLIDELPDESSGPAARYERKESISLAFIVALQYLTAGQRAALVLHDVLGFPSSEAAQVLEASEAALNSSLQRARSKLSQRLSSDTIDHAPLAGSRDELELMTRFTEAFERGDVQGVVDLLRSDARMTMPPQLGELTGAEEIGNYLTRLFASWGSRGARLVRTGANGQPAFGCYIRSEAAVEVPAEGIIVLEIDGVAIAALTRFATADVVPFGLPPLLRATS